MAILAECPVCHRKQATKNKKCKCGQDMDKAKKGKKKVRYWISYRLPDGKQKRESVGAFDDLDACSITDAKVADSKRKVQKKEKRFLEMIQGYDLTFDDLFKWYLELPKVKKLRSYDSTVSVLRAFNNEFGNQAVNTILPEKLQSIKRNHKIRAWN